MLPVNTIIIEIFTFSTGQLLDPLLRYTCVTSLYGGISVLRLLKGFITPIADNPSSTTSNKRLSYRLCRLYFHSCQKRCGCWKRSPALKILLDTKKTFEPRENSIPNPKPFPPHPTVASSVPAFKLTHLASLCHEILIISYPSLELRSSFVAISDVISLHSPRLPQRGGKTGQCLENTGRQSHTSTQSMATINP